MHQASFAAEMEAQKIQWSFDPTIRLNAYFNFTKLGCRIDRQLPNFSKEGELDIADRLLVSLELDSLFNSTLIRAISENKKPRPTIVQPEKHIVVSTPQNIERLRIENPTEAVSAQMKFNKELDSILRNGNQFIGFSRNGEYVFDMYNADSRI